MCPGQQLRDCPHVTPNVTAGAADFRQLSVDIPEIIRSSQAFLGPTRARAPSPARPLPYPKRSRMPRGAAINSEACEVDPVCSLPKKIY
jgi:hypothetical protein